MFDKYDLIVVGAGHAGCEAAAAAANMGSKVLLATMNMGTIAQMSCNPAIGGVAKGQIVREIDALGGQTGLVTDKSTLQFRMLNRSKGPAMWSPRAQNDRVQFAEVWRFILEKNKNVDFWQEMVVGLLVKKNKVIGIKTGLGVEIKGKAVVLTNGTFFNFTLSHKIVAAKIGKEAFFEPEILIEPDNSLLPLINNFCIKDLNFWKCNALLFHVLAFSLSI